jgi:membrane fusion protein (multidrug efflux system)
VIAGLAAGDKVIVEGLQRTRAGQTVSPGPASALILTSMKAAADGTAPQADHGASGKTRPLDSKP